VLVEGRKAEIVKANSELVSEMSNCDVEMIGTNPMQNSTIAKLQKEVKALKLLVDVLVAERETDLHL
jgi:hypothetical protein